MWKNVCNNCAVPPQLKVTVDVFKIHTSLNHDEAVFVHCDLCGIGLVGKCKDGALIIQYKNGLENLKECTPEFSNN